MIQLSDAGPFLGKADISKSDTLVEEGNEQENLEELID
jgi:hypothetical protein